MIRASGKTSFLSKWVSASPLALLGAALLYVSLSALVLGANPFDNQTVAPTDVLASYPAFSSEGYAGITHPERSDVLDAYLPMWAEAREQLRSGETGWWLPSFSGGVPGIQLLSNGMLTPSFAAFVATPSLGEGMYASGLVRLLIAGFGAFLFLRLFVGFWPAWVGGAIFMLSSFHAAWFFWPQVTTSAWIPWLLWAGAGWMLSPRPRWLLALTASTAFLVLGGFPSVAAFGLYAWALFMLFLHRDGQTLRQWFTLVVLAGLAILAGFLLASLPLLAQWEFLQQFDLGYREGGDTVLDWQEHWPLFFDPDALGMPRVETTIYMGVVAMGLALLSFVRTRSTGPSNEQIRLRRFAVTLVVLSVMLAFAILPPGLIGLIPVFNFNPWQRVMVLFGLGIALLAGLGLHRGWQLAKTWRSSWRWSLAGLLLVLAGFQLLDQSSLFRDFNGAVPSEPFLPPSTAALVIQEDQDRFDWAVADRSAWVGGTLVSYGVAEWFAHGFKTSEEKAALEQLVDSPFVTPTAAQFEMGQINFDSPMMQALNVRHVLARASDAGRLVMEQPLGPGSRPSPPLHEAHLEQKVSLERPLRLAGVSILIGTHGREIPDDAITVQITDEGGELLATAFPVDEVLSDNSLVHFALPEAVVVPAGNLLLVIEARTEIPLSVWTVPRTDFGQLFVEHEPVARSMRYRLFSPLALPSDWSVQYMGEEVSVFRNDRAPAGPYFSKALGDSPEASSASGLTTVGARPDKLNIQYHGGDSGWIVLPMRFFPGWRAYEGGKELTMDAAFGMLPAIPVDGPASIQVRYRPAWVGLGIWLTALGFVLLFALMGAATGKFGRYTTRTLKQGSGAS